MFRHYIATSLRFAFKNKTFSFINIIGLAVGTLCCLYIVMYVLDQHNYDKHHNDAEHIFRINSLLVLPGGQNEKMATASPPVAPAMKNDFAEVAEFTRTTAAIGIMKTPEARRQTADGRRQTADARSADAPLGNDKRAIHDGRLTIDVRYYTLWNEVFVMPTHSRRRKGSLKSAQNKASQVHLTEGHKYQNA